MKLHRLAKNDPTYLLLAGAIGTDENGQLNGFDTDPYGSGPYRLGSVDDFLCGGFDIQPLTELLPKLAESGTVYGPEHLGMMVVVTHLTINSETGSFIDDSAYQVNLVDVSDIDKVRQFCREMDNKWCDSGFDDVKHDRRYRNQDEHYFYRALFRDLIAHHLPIGEKRGWYSPRQAARYSKSIYAGCLRFKSKVPRFLQGLLDGKE